MNNLKITPVQKRAVFKLAVDLAKVDRQIHGNEIALLNSLQADLNVTKDELEMIHYMSLQQCLEALQSLNHAQKDSVGSFFQSMLGVDDDLDKREQMLFAAIQIAFNDDTSSWAKVISVNGDENECPSNQIIYLEKKWCEHAHVVLDDKLDSLLITKALNEVGLQFFYLPQVKQNIDVDLLQRSMEYILPIKERCGKADMEDSLRKITSIEFLKAFCSTYRLSPGCIPYEAFILAKVQEGEILNEEGRLSRCIDFLCIDVTSDLRKRLSHFVDFLDAPVSALCYDGYYRLLYDQLSSARSIVTTLYIDHKYDFFIKTDSELKMKFDSAPQAKTLYLLLLRYGTSGVTQECFEEAEAYLKTHAVTSACQSWDLGSFKTLLLKENKDYTRLIYNIVSIYSSISTKDSTIPSFLNYISTILRQRSALKSYVINAFASISSVYERERYSINFDKNLKIYYLEADTSLISISESDHEVCGIRDSKLWSDMII